MLQVIGSQSECVPRPSKRLHPREGAARAKRTRRNNGQIDEEEEKEASATKKSSSETDMLWSQDDDDSDDDVPLFSVLQGRKTATARRKNPSGKKTADRSGNTRVAVADSTTVDLSDSTMETVVDVSDTPTPTSTSDTTGSLLPPRGTLISTDSVPKINPLYTACVIQNYTGSRLQRATEFVTRRHFNQMPTARLPTVRATCERTDWQTHMTESISFATPLARSKNVLVTSITRYMSIFQRLMSIRSRLF